jgi:hypothetical protein
VTLSPLATLKLRTATDHDVPQLRRLISDSARRLSAGYYSTEQITACIDDVSGVFMQLIVDRSY